VKRGYLSQDHLLENLIHKNSAVAYQVEATLLLVLTGGYIGIVPDHVALPWANLGLLYRVPLAEFRTERPVFLIKRRSLERARSAELLFNAIWTAFMPANPPFS
jgi:DNA-binding transcriptional LysR family regulator